MSKTAQKTFVRIDPSLEGKIRARLETRNYDSQYTQIPNTKLPSGLYGQLKSVYEAIGGNQFEDGSTFLIQAKEGMLSNIFSPSVYASPVGDDGVTRESIVIKWGNEAIEVPIQNGGLIFPTKVKWSIKKEKIGKYANPCLTLVVTTESEVVTMPLSIKAKEFTKEGLDPDKLTYLLEEGNAQAFLDQLSRPSEKKGGGGRLVGPVVKLACLPVDNYVITNYIKYESAYGTKHLLQALANETITVEVIDRETKVANDVTISKGEKFIIKPNSRIDTVLLGGPLITPESPAELRLLEIGEYNDFPTAKAQLVVNHGQFLEDKDCILDF